MTAKQTLISAKSKLFNPSGKEWQGFLTPSEIIALHNAGVRSATTSRNLICHARNAKAVGSTEGMWYHCYLGKVTIDPKEMQKFRLSQLKKLLYS